VPATTPWFPGAEVPLTWTNTDTEGNPQDAASLGSVALAVLQPDLTTVTPGFTRTSTGTYLCNFPTVQSGHHVYTFISTDPTYPGAFSDSFEVQLATDTTIVSQAEAKEILHLTDTTQFDAILHGYNAAATEWIDYVCGPVVQRTVVEKLPSRGETQALSKPPVTGLVAWTDYPPGLANSGITIPDPPSPMFPTMFFGVAYPLDELYADPKTGIVTHTSGLPFIYGSYLWQYTAGRPVIPSGIYEAAKITLEHLFAVERGGGRGTAGEDETTDTGFGFAVPNRAIELLMPHSGASRMVAA
jgi:hypothetical protein